MSERSEGMDVALDPLVGRILEIAKDGRWLPGTLELQMVGALAALRDENKRLRGLLGEPLRVIVVQSIREATGCPDLKGRDGEYLSEKVLALAKALLPPNAEVHARRSLRVEPVVGREGGE